MIVVKHNGHQGAFLGSRMFGNSHGNPPNDFGIVMDTDGTFYVHSGDDAGTQQTVQLWKSDGSFTSLCRK
jgi:hypothetical protein